VDPATVSTFALDKYLVTVGRFRQFANAVTSADGGASWLPPPGSGKHTHLNGGLGLVGVGGDGGVAYEPGWLAPDDGNLAPGEAIQTCMPMANESLPFGDSNDNLPMACVNWYEAYAFCIWDGGFLPSEAEWEYAAAGGSEQREYPWGSMDPGTHNQYAIYGCYYLEPGICTTGGHPAPVGTASLGAGLWGQLDLAGNVSEWNADWSAAYDNPCVDCATLAWSTPERDPSDRVNMTRGGAFDYDLRSGTLQASWREGAGALNRDYTIGFRCARAP
jgi:sulfatase modifying factor 1